MRSEQGLTTPLVEHQSDPGMGGIFTVKERVGHRLVTTTQMALGDKTLGSTPACKETRGVVSLPYLDFFHGFLDRNMQGNRGVLE